MARSKYKFLKRQPVGSPLVASILGIKDYLFFDDGLETVAVTEDWKYWYPVEVDEHGRTWVSLIRGGVLAPDLLRRPDDPPSDRTP